MFFIIFNIDLCFQWSHPFKLQGVEHSVREIQGSRFTASVNKIPDFFLFSIFFSLLSSSWFCWCSYIWNIEFYIWASAGLEILGFPCNQFLGQEPGSNEEIQETACTMFKAEFPIFGKVLVFLLRLPVIIDESMTRDAMSRTSFSLSGNFT